MRNTRNYLDVHSVVDGPYIADPPTPPTPPTPPAPVTYTVTFDGDTDYYTAAFVAGSSSPALEGSSVNFTVVPDDGHVITSVTDGTNTLTAVNGVYTINAIAADYAIKVEAALIPAPVTHTVTLPNGAGKGYTAAFVAGSSSPAVAGSSVYFTVVAEEGHVITSVTDGTNTLTAVNGVYTINGIAADTVIGVSAGLIPAPVTHTVTLTPGTGYTAAFVAGSSSPAVAGSVVNFTVVADEGYVIDEVTVGNNTLTGVNGVYTINAIAANTTIAVEAGHIFPTTYTVTLPSGTGYTAAFVAGSSSPAVAGSVVNFTVTPEVTHTITSVSDGTNTLTPVNGVYTTYGIAANAIIEVVATLIPAPVTHTVTLPNGAGKGYTAAFVAGSSSPAVAGSTVNFTVVAEEGYVITSVTDGTNTLTDINGVYTINEIADNFEIAVVATLIPVPVADFTYEAKDNHLSIEFTNTSTDAVFYSWDFGDGTNSISENHTHTYAAAGQYTVVLTVQNIAGVLDTETKSITV